VVETERVILAELELLAPTSEVPAPDWRQVRERFAPSERSVGRRRARLAFGVAAIALSAVVAAGAAYFSSRGAAPKPVTNGELVIDSAPRAFTLSTVGVDGRLRTLWRCPRKVDCVSPGGMSWSPDGKQLALLMVSVSHLAPYEGLDILTLRTRRLTHLSTARACQGSGFGIPGGVDWSPDGRWIALTCGSSKILLIRPAGTVERAISTGLANVRSPSWSPDGRRLVFSAGKVDHSAIYAIDADGSHRRRLARGRAPAWSPNSSLIAYRGATHGGSCGGLRLVDADTGRDASPASAANPCHQFGPPQAEAPEWSPDGTEIAIGAVSGVYVINADGTDLRHINSTAPYSGKPAWRPGQGTRSVRYGDRAESCPEC
jgi:Tol biopolymer transport system component